ncbi:MAG: hypothetical protein COC05_05495 [Gammaproteobacteria bacterium]|nr:MAG: hypothetical protein COC05_05495 [Gammaproteobacteria bacterium]
MQARENVGAEDYDFTIQNHTSANADEWIKQISLRRSSFEYDHRLKYPLDVQPSVVDGKASLIVAPDLEVRDPFAFDYIRRFAEENSLVIIIDMCEGFIFEL